jgi:hypothetical protein
LVSGGEGEGGFGRSAGAEVGACKIGFMMMAFDLSKVLEVGENKKCLALGSRISKYMWEISLSLSLLLRGF